MIDSSFVPPKDYLELHKMANIEERPFECKMCPKICITKAELDKHIIKDHTVQYSCDVCNKSFGCNKYLKRHKMYHTDLRAFQCEMCPKT